MVNKTKLGYTFLFILPYNNLFCWIFNNLTFYLWCIFLLFIDLIFRLTFDFTNFADHYVLRSWFNKVRYYWTWIIFVSNLFNIANRSKNIYPNNNDCYYWKRERVVRFLIFSNYKYVLRKAKFFAHMKNNVTKGIEVLKE